MGIVGRDRSNGGSRLKSSSLPPDRFFGGAESRGHLPAEIRILR